MLPPPPRIVHVMLMHSKSVSRTAKDLLLQIATVVERRRRRLKRRACKGTSNLIAFFEKKRFESGGGAASIKLAKMSIYMRCKNACASLHMYVCLCVCIYIWQRLKNIGLVASPGGLFATRFVTESGGLATNPPCDKPVEDYGTRHRRPRQGFVTEGPRQRFVTEAGTATNPCFEALPHMYST